MQLEKLSTSMEKCTSGLPVNLITTGNKKRENDWKELQNIEEKGKKYERELSQNQKKRQKKRKIEREPVFSAREKRGPLLTF